MADEQAKEVKKKTDEEIVYVTMHDIQKPEKAEDRSTVLSANGVFYGFDETKPIPVPKNVLGMFLRAKNVVYRTKFEGGQPVTTKTISNRYSVEYHDAPAN